MNALVFGGWRNLTNVKKIGTAGPSFLDEGQAASFLGLVLGCGFVLVMFRIGQRGRISFRDLYRMANLAS